LKNLLQATDEGRPQLLSVRHDLHPEGAKAKHNRWLQKSFNVTLRERFSNGYSLLYIIYS